MTADVPSPMDSLVATCDRLGMGQIQRHLFLCCDQTKPLCCSKEASLETWNYLKRRLGELGIDSSQPGESAVRVFRTKANCLRVCQNGPILLVYPDGIWYRAVTPTVMETILQDHILGDRPVVSHQFFVHPLPPSSP